MLTSRYQSALVFAMLGAAALLLAGCDQPQPIRTYTVAKDAPDRMLGGILLQDDRGWFFKLTGPRAELDAAADQFRDFLQSIRVEPGDERPQWKLPAGWEVDSRPRQMRLATINVPLKSAAGKTQMAELTVTVLPRTSGDETPYLLANINRWRDQMGQGRITPQQVDALEKIKSQAGDIFLVTIAGRQKAAGMTGPFSGGGG
jgi:hypothetical protein